MDLKEWAESLYRSADPKLADYGQEILELFALEDRDELLGGIEEDLDYYAKRLCIRESEPRRIIEKMADECNLVIECQHRLKEHGFEGQDLDDQCEELARIVADIKQTLECMGGYEIGPETDIDLLVQDLCQRPKFDL